MYTNLIKFLQDRNIDENDSIGLVKDGMQKRKERQDMRVREKERRELMNEALKWYRKEKNQ